MHLFFLLGCISEYREKDLFGVFQSYEEVFFFLFPK